MSLLPLLILSFFAWAASDAEKDPCLNLKTMDQFAKQAGKTVSYGEGCRKGYERIAEIHREMRLAAGGTTFQAPSISGATQAEMLGDAAAIANQGGMSKEARAAILKSAAEKQLIVAEKFATAKKEYVKDAIEVRKKYAANPGNYDLYAQNGAAEIENVRKVAAAYANAAASAVNEQLAGAEEMYRNEHRIREAQDNLDGGDRRKSGVSKNTLVALGGAAVISAGVVGGLYWAGNKMIDKADRKAAERIADAEERALNIIREAEAAAKRVFEYAEGSVDRIISNAAGSVDKIYQRVQTNFESLLTDMDSDIQGVYGKLTTPGLEKLKTEMDEIFDKVEQRAIDQNQPGLVERIQTARARVMSKIQEEIDRRNPTSTSSTTSSSTSTNTESESAVNTDTSSNTQTSTTTATSSGSSSALPNRTTIQPRTTVDSR